MVGEEQARIRGDQELITYHARDGATLLLGDALEAVMAMGGGSVDCIVTSPPYYGLRDYGQGAQYGNEPTVAEYVATMARLFRECQRVLSEDGTFWLNLGDTTENKNLLLVPARVAIALQADGWVLRSDVIWHKTNAIPEPVKDRPSRRHEHLFLFTKNRKHHFDLDAIREPHKTIGRHAKHTQPWQERATNGKTKMGVGSSANMGFSDGGKNPGDVWAFGTARFKGAHFAPFPTEIPRRAILSGCRPGGTVLDPFSGSATTGMVALELGRKYIGIDINPEYHDLALSTRLRREHFDTEEAA